jgi:hypothetical protein
MVKRIQSKLKEVYDSRVQVKSLKTKSNTVMEKLLFIEIVKLLIEADERSAIMESMGLNLEEYENLYYTIVHNLFRLSFSDKQIELINYFIYELPLQEEFEGKLELTKGKKTLKFNFSTPEDLWEVLKEVK